MINPNPSISLLFCFRWRVRSGQRLHPARVSISPSLLAFSTSSSPAFGYSMKPSSVWRLIHTLMDWTNASGLLSYHFLLFRLLYCLILLSFFLCTQLVYWVNSSIFFWCNKILFQLIQKNKKKKTLQKFHYFILCSKWPEIPSPKQ